MGIKMWQRILDIHIPKANNYQDRIIIKSHKLTELVKDKIKLFEQTDENFGEIKVKSFTCNNFYNIKLKQVCKSHCRTLYCRVRKISIHHYQCDYPEYTVKNIMCKHVRLKRMREVERRGINSYVDNYSKILGTNSNIKPNSKKKLLRFTSEKNINQEFTKAVDDLNKKISIQREEFYKWVDNLNKEVFERFMRNIQGAKKQNDQIANKETKVSKKKMENRNIFLLNIKNLIIASKRCYTFFSVVGS